AARHRPRAVDREGHRGGARRLGRGRDAAGGRGIPSVPAFLASATICPRVVPRPAATHGHRRGMRIVTYNLHFGRAVDRIARAIERSPHLRDGGVFLLQEVRSYPSEGTSRAARLALALGLRHVYAPSCSVGRGGTHGLAILSRWPIGDVKVLQ